MNTAHVVTLLGTMASLFSVSHLPADATGCVERVILRYNGSFSSLNRASDDMAAAERALAEAYQAMAVGYDVIVTARHADDRCACGALHGRGCFCAQAASEEEDEEETCSGCGATHPGACQCEDTGYFEAIAAA